MSGFLARPELAGTFGAVASTHWLASAVGMRLLEAGGNAFDAAVAAGFTLQIVEPHLNGPGGDVPILAARAGETEPAVICGQGPAPGAANIEHFEALGLDLVPGTGLLAACVPGAFGAWATLLRDWGTVSLRAALEPAIGYALGGHPVLGSVVDTIASVRELFEEDWPTSAAVFLPGGEPPEAGELFANLVLGRLYAAVLDHAEAAGGGREAQIEAALDYWYRGPVAEAIGRFCAETEALDSSERRHRGLLTAADMAGWTAPVERPLSVDYRGHRVFKCGAWSQGPAMLQALRILDGRDVAGMDPGGPDLVHLYAETMKLVMADRDAWYGDESGVPVEALLSAEYADVRRGLIGERASLDFRPGSPEGRAPRTPALRLAEDKPERAAGGGEPTFAKAPARGKRPRGDTCHLDVVDRWGNMVAATPSGGWLQSSPVVPELGFALGTRLQMAWLEPGLPNSLAPGKRPRTTLTPSMAYRDGRPYMAFGTPGGDQQEQWSLWLFLLHVDRGLGLQRAIEAPAFHSEHLISSFWPRTFAPGRLVVEGRFSGETVEELRRRGHDVKVGGDWSEGRLSACVREASGLVRAGANPRGAQGYAIAR
jgi:gamma-glutamyltranspeptidase/glutathione hydrolase